MGDRPSHIDNGGLEGSDFATEFAKRHPEARDVPETKIAIAKQAAEVLSSEYADSLPAEELYPLTYRLAAKALETMLRDSPTGFQTWKDDNQVESKMLDVVIQTALKMRGEVAVPSTVDPQRYIKDTKRDRRWSKIFSRAKKQKEFDLEIHKLVVDAVERVEALNIAANQIELKNQRAIEHTKQEGDRIISEAKAEENSAKERLQILENRIAELRAEAQQDPSLAGALARMEEGDKKERKNSLIEKARSYSERIKAIHSNAIVGPPEKSVMFYSIVEKITKQNHNEVTVLLKEFVKSLRALQTIEAEYGPAERQEVGREVGDDISLNQDLWVSRKFGTWADSRAADSFVEGKALKNLGKLLGTDSETFTRIVKKGGLVIPELIKKIESGTGTTLWHGDFADEINNLHKTLIEK